MKPFRCRDLHSPSKRGRVSDVIITDIHDSNRSYLYYRAAYSGYSLNYIEGTFKKGYEGEKRKSFYKRLSLFNQVRCKLPENR